MGKKKSKLAVEEQSFLFGETFEDRMIRDQERREAELLAEKQKSKERSKSLLNSKSDLSPEDQIYLKRAQVRAKYEICNGKVTLVLQY